MQTEQIKSLKELVPPRSLKPRKQRTFNFDKQKKEREGRNKRKEKEQGKTSNGELKVIEWCRKEKVEFEREKKYADCVNPKTGRRLPFDFYLPLFNTLVEVDGEGHSEVIPDWQDTPEKLKERKERDAIKTAYCKANNILLLRIPFSQFSLIDIILKVNLYKQ